VNSPELPSAAASAISHWSWRLLLATGDAKYADHMERVRTRRSASRVADAAGAFPVTVIAIPYFQWDNRDGRGMRVWMRRVGG
jgi:DUF1680 family protein